MCTLVSSIASILSQIHPAEYILLAITAWGVAAAFYANFLTREYASAAFLHELLSEYRSEDFDGALQRLRRIKNLIDNGEFPKAGLAPDEAIALWQHLKQDSGTNTTEIDKDRHLVHQYYKHVSTLRRARLLTTRQYNVVLSQAGLELFVEVAAPLSIGKHLSDIDPDDPGRFAWVHDLAADYKRVLELRNS